MKAALSLLLFDYKKSLKDEAFLLCYFLLVTIVTIDTVFGNKTN